jgi:hypothetical protein
LNNVACILLLLLLSGCNLNIGPCEADRRAGIALSILDSIARGPVLVDSIRVTATDGSFADTMRFTNLRPDPVTGVGLAWEREGVYNLLVVATGYRIWQRNQVRVRDAGCHVNTVRVTALLQRASG